MFFLYSITGGLTSLFGPLSGGKPEGAKNRKYDKFYIEKHKVFIKIVHLTIYTYNATYARDNVVQ